MRTLLFLLSILSMVHSTMLDTTHLHDYRAITLDTLYDGTPHKAIRQWQEHNSTRHLIVDTATLTTRIVDSLTPLDTPPPSRLSELQKALLAAPHPLHNAGLTRTHDKSVILTVDMCPSRKPSYEKALFDYAQTHHIPLAIAITARWVAQHPDAFRQILDAHLSITWVNHTATHYYDPHEHNLSRNFLLHEPSSLETEIFETEKMLIAHGQIPSVFFRFPGLVSSPTLVRRLIEEFTLLPVGTSNWLAISGKPIETGDIVLVHGNGNEPSGIRRFLEAPYEGNYSSIGESVGR